MSRPAVFALGALAGAAALTAFTWAYVLYDAWTMEHQRAATAA